MTERWYGPNWLEPLADQLNTPLFRRTRTLRLDGIEVTDTLLPHVAQLPRLELLEISSTARISKQGLSLLQQQRPELNIRQLPPGA